jgi:hypothetical protein
MGIERGDEMGDIPDASVHVPIPAEDIIGLGVAGPSAEPPEEEVTEIVTEETTVIQQETTGYSEEHLGRNVDIEV